MKAFAAGLGLSLGGGFIFLLYKDWERVGNFVLLAIFGMIAITIILAFILAIYGRRTPPPPTNEYPMPRAPRINTPSIIVMPPGYPMMGTSPYDHYNSYPSIASPQAIDGMAELVD